MNKTSVYRQLWSWIVVVGVLCLMSGAAQAQIDDTELTPLEISQVAEIRHILGEYAAEVWPGWELQLTPLLVRKGDFDYLIGHPDPPPEFVDIPSLTINGETVFRMEGHLSPAPVATAWQVDALWAAAIPVRDEFQSAVDELFGEGIIVLDDAAYIRAAVHEAFHAYQMNTFHGPESLPPAVMMTSSPAWLEDFSESQIAELDANLLAEGQTLNTALDPDASLEEIAVAASDFLRLRKERRVHLPSEALDFERGTEWMEGAARYVDTRLMLLAGSPDYEPSMEAPAAGVVYPLADEVWSHFRAQVNDPVSIPGTYRDRFYVLGAAQMFVLDRLLPGWQTRLFTGEQMVEDLLNAALEER
ncbi:MAG: hypothetical protein JNJ61_16055 [Anaerolineae bacterium]|nr:hypothetical protein [Anaerolineae bacterium]